MTEGSGAGSAVETSETMPRGVIHDRGCRCWPHIEASAVAQLRADLDAARTENHGLLLDLDMTERVRVETLTALEAAQGEIERVTSDCQYFVNEKDALEERLSLIESSERQQIAELRADLAQARARIAVLERDIVLWRQAGEAWDVRAQIVPAAAEYMAILAKRQREALGEDYEAIMAEMEQSTEGSQKLAEAKARLIHALDAAQAAGGDSEP